MLIEKDLIDVTVIQSILTGVQESPTKEKNEVLIKSEVLKEVSEAISDLKNFLSESSTAKLWLTYHVLTKTGTQLERPGTGRNQLEPAENHLEPPVYISGISWNHQTRVKNQLLSWNQQWFHILRYLNFCKTKIRT